MRAVPARERVGAEARVHQRQRGLHQRIAEIREVRRELHRRQHAFVDERLVRQAGDVPGRRAFQRRRTDLGVSALADHVQLALERELIRDRGIALDEHLAHERLARLRGVAEHRVVARNGAPAEHGLAFRLHDLLEALLDAPAQRRIARQEHDAAAVLAGLRQLDSRFLAGFAQEAVGHLHQHAGAVAAVFLGAAGAAVIEVHQDLQALLQDAVGFAALDVDDEADAAGVMLERRIVQTLLGRQTRPARTAPLGAAHVLPRPLYSIQRARIRSAYTAPGSVKALIQQDSAARLRAADARCKERFAGGLLNTTRRIDRILQRSTPASMRAPVRVADLPLAPFAHQDQIEVVQVGRKAAASLSQPPRPAIPTCNLTRASSAAGNSRLSMRVSRCTDWFEMK